MSIVVKLNVSYLTNNLLVTFCKRTLDCYCKKPGKNNLYFRTHKLKIIWRIWHSFYFILFKIHEKLNGMFLVLTACVCTIYSFTHSIVSFFPYQHNSIINFWEFHTMHLITLTSFSSQVYPPNLESYPHLQKKKNTPSLICVAHILNRAWSNS